MIAINQYRAMKSVPAGAILNSIIAQKRQTKAAVARAACILPQRVNDLIMGTRRFTVDTSIKIEKALDIQETGFFYLHQAEHDIYLSELEMQRQQHPDLSVLTKTTFWDVNLAEINWQSAKGGQFAACWNMAIRKRSRRCTIFMGALPLTRKCSIRNRFVCKTMSRRIGKS